MSPRRILAALAMLALAVLTAVASAQDGSAGAIPSETELAALLKNFEKNYGGAKKVAAAEAYLAELAARAAEAAAEADGDAEGFAKELEALRGYADRAYLPEELHASEFKIVKKIIGDAKDSGMVHVGFMTTDAPKG